MMFEYKKRLNKLRSELIKKSLDSFLVTNETNVTYLSGFTGSDSLLLVTPSFQFFLTDSRYTEEAKDSVKGFAITEVMSSTYSTIGEIIKKNRIKRLGFESLNLPFEVARRLERHIHPAKAVPLRNTIEDLRAVKDTIEIECIKKSVRLTEGVLKKAIAKIRPGVSEKFLSNIIECEFIKYGARMAFDIISACGKNCSKPHAHPTGDRIAKNDIVMIDIGCKFNLYNSDITRMVFIGRIKDKIKEIYAIVRSAREKALEMIRPGRIISEIDSAGRSYIEKKGFGKFFGHSLGHGVGMDVHEEPSISRRNNEALKPGMVFTIEPAIYIPKFAGVRIEDMVLVTDNGYEILTR